MTPDFSANSGAWQLQAPLRPGYGRRLKKSTSGPWWPAKMHVQNHPHGHTDRRLANICPATSFLRN